jgi:hypothetical protein
LRNGEVPDRRQFAVPVWHEPDYVHVFDLNGRWADWEIWDYAKMHGLTIVAKGRRLGWSIAETQLFSYR